MPKTIHEHYESYTKSLDVQTTTESGFTEFTPRDPASQLQYDASKPSWVGIEKTEEAIKNGVFAEDSAIAERDPKVETLPKSKATKEDWCSIQ